MLVAVREQRGVGVDELGAVDEGEAALDAELLEQQAHEGEALGICRGRRLLVVPERAHDEHGNAFEYVGDLVEIGTDVGLDP